MGERIIKEISRADYPDAKTLLGRCTEPGCLEEPKQWASPNTDLAVAFLRGWFERHVLETGHSILIVEPESVGDADALRGAGGMNVNRSRPTVGESA